MLSSSPSRALIVIPRAPVALPPKPRPSLKPLLYGIPLAAIFVMGYILYLQMTTPVEITLFPPQWPVTKTMTVSTNPRGEEILALVINGQSSTITQSVLASQIVHHPATAAHGIVMLYNQNSTTVLVPAQTIIPTQDGHTIITEQSVQLPPDTNGLDPIMGSGSTPASTRETGKASNLPAKMVDGVCLPCGPGIILINEAFTGGQDESNEPILRDQDIAQSVKPLLPAFEAQAKADVLAHLAQGEELLPGSMQCALQIRTDAPVGSHVESVQATVSNHCTAAVFDIKALQTALKPDVSVPFQPLGPVQFQELAPFIPAHADTLRVTIQATQMWIRSFSPEQLQRCAQAIAGKSVNDAQTILSQQLGVKNVVFSLPTLPTSAQLIIWHVQQAKG